MADENQPAGGENRPTTNRRPWIRALEWAGFCVGALILIVVVLAVEAVHSPRLHKYLVSFAERKASQSLGVPVDIKDYSLHFPNAPGLSRIDLDVYGLTVHGALPYPDPPLVQIQHVNAKIGLSILERKWSLDDIRVDVPIVHLFEGANGESNLPKAGGGGGGNFNLFNLGIQHFVLDRGEVYYKDKKIPIDADLSNLQLRAHSSSGRSGFAGTLSYRDGHLQAGSLRTIPHNLNAEFEATPNEFDLSDARLTSGPSQFKVTATVKDYAHPIVKGRYQALLDGSQLQTILRNASIPAGRIEASGSLGYQAIAGRPFLQQLSVRGNLQSRVLDLKEANTLIRLSSVAADYSLTNGNLSVKNLRGRLLGGTLQAGLEMSDLGGNSHSELQADVRRLSLSALRQTAGSGDTAGNLALNGIVDATVRAAWGKELQRSLVARINASIHGGMSAKAGTAAGRALPVNGVLHGTYMARDNRLEVAGSYLRMPQTSLTMNGALGKRSSLALHFQSKNLGELETVLNALRTPKAGSAATPLGLGGTASFEGRVTGNTASPHLTGHLSAANLRVKGTEWHSLQTDVQADPSSVSLQNTELKPAAQGQIHLNASVSLTKWIFDKSSHAQVDLRAAQISIADISRLVSLPTGITGTLAANVHFDGTELNPGGKGTISLTHAQIHQQPLRSATASFTAESGDIRAKMTIELDAGTIESVATIQPREKSYTAQINTNGLDLSKLQLLQERNINVTGTVLLTGSGKGTFQNPQFTASANIPKLGIHDVAISGVALKIDVANHVANATLAAHEEKASIQAQATLHMTGDYPIQASLDTQPVALKPFFVIYAPDEADNLSGEAEVHAKVEGPLKRKELLNAQITIPSLKLGYGNAVEVEAQAPIHIGYRNQVLTMERTTLRGTDIDLDLQGAIPIRGHGTPSLLVKGTINLKIAQLLDPEIKSSGELRLNINGLGSGGGGAEGKIELVNANLVNGNWPVGLERGNAELTLTKDHLNIDRLTASVGGGQLTASGGLAYRPNLQFDLGMSAKGVRMLYPQGVREEVDADVRLTGKTDGARLGGRVRIVDLAFTPDFDFMNLISQFGGVSAPPSQGFAQNLNLNLAVNSTNNIDLTSRTLSIGGTANLEVRGTAARPVILGRIDLSSGDVIFNGTRFLIGGGTVEFANPSETQPVVNLALDTTIQQYNINMRFRGPVDHLRTNFSSDPALPEADIISLLAFGKTTEANSANPTTPANQAAMSMVASQVSSQVTSRVSRIAGISQLSINPVLAGGSNQGPAGAVITIQQRVTGNLFVTFSTNVTSTEYQTIMGQYRFSPRTAISATRDQNGGFGVDLTLKKTW